jgi:hypothetical protein
MLAQLGGRSRARVSKHGAARIVPLMLRDAVLRMASQHEGESGAVDKKLALRQRLPLEAAPHSTSSTSFGSVPNAFCAKAAAMN